MTNESALEMRAHLEMRLRVLAQRIVEAAEIAATMHLREPPPEVEANEHYGQRAAAGGAGSPTPGGSEDSRLPTRPPRGEDVTDDDSPAPPPPAADQRFAAWRPRYHPAD